MRAARISANILSASFVLLSAASSTVADEVKAANKIPGVSLSCNILMDDSLEVQGTNTTTKSYDCDVTCNLKTTSGASATFQCTPVLPANTANGSLCRGSGSFKQITGGKQTCK